MEQVVLLHAMPVPIGKSMERLACSMLFPLWGTMAHTLRAYRRRDRITARWRFATDALHDDFGHVSMADLSSTDPRAALMTRLVEMRAGLVAEMVASGYSSGLGARLAEIAAALAALREETPETTGSPAPCDGAKPKERK